MTRARETKRPGLALGFALFGLALACVDSPEIEDEFGSQIAPDCTREGSFEVELGEDQGGFVSLPEGSEPVLYHGAQGGTHLILAAHITTPDPIDRYEMAIKAEIGAPECDTDEDCSSFFPGGQYSRVIEGPDRVDVYDDASELPYLFLVVDGWDPNRLRKVTLDVSDACGRSATDVRVFLPYHEHRVELTDRPTP